MNINGGNELTNLFTIHDFEKKKEQIETLNVSKDERLRKILFNLFLSFWSLMRNLIYKRVKV